MSKHALGGCAHSACNFMCESGLQAEAFPCIVNVWPSALSSQATCLNGESSWDDACSGSNRPDCDSVTSSQAACCDSTSLILEKSASADGTGTGDGCAHVSHTAGPTVNAPGSPCRAGAAVGSANSQSPGGGSLNAVRKQKGGLSAALKATPGASAADHNALAARGLNRVGAQLADAQRASGLIAQGTRVAAAQAHETAVAAAMANLNRGAMSSARSPADGQRTTVNKTVPPPTATTDLEEASRAGDAALSSVSEAAWDSLPFFSPSLVDRLWAGRASDDDDSGTASPRSRHPIRHFHIQRLQQQHQQQQEPQPQAQPQPHPQQPQREGGVRKRSHPGQRPKPARCLFFQQQQQQQQPRNGSAPPRRATLDSGASTPAAAASIDADVVLAPRATAAAAAANQVQGNQVQGRGGAAAAVEARDRHVTGVPGLSRGTQAAPGVTSALTAAAAAAAASSSGGRVPCMALVAAAGAPAAAPRAGGPAAAAAAAGGGSSSSGCKRAAAGGPDGRWRLAPKPPPGADKAAAAAAPAGVLAQAAAAAPATSAAPPGGPDASSCDALPPQAIAAAVAPAPTAAAWAPEGGACCGIDVLAPVQPPAAAAAADSRAEQRPRVSSAAAALAAMAMSAYEAPRGHVHNGPRMPLGAAGSPPSLTASRPHPQEPAAEQTAPAPPPLRLSRLSACGSGAAAAATAAAALMPDGAAESSSRRDDPWVGGGCPLRELDSPVSQASTEWEPRAGASLASLAAAASLGVAWRGSAGALGSERVYSQASLTGDSELGAAGYDGRTQWWGRDLGAGRFHDGDDARMRRSQYERSPGRQRRGGAAAAAGGGGAGRRSWWWWLLPGK
ncbi:hypothetical protein PLESTM_001620900 [Pleodorina starrii]|nr:hypothetical protein PLESTM_001620900 [Pleodorina starrii]